MDLFGGTSNADQCHPGWRHYHGVRDHSAVFLLLWKNTHDRFFLYFAISFALETLSRALFLANHSSADEPLIYLIRLLAYILILLAILEKNRRPSQ